MLRKGPFASVLRNLLYDSGDPVQIALSGEACSVKTRFAAWQRRNSMRLADSAARLLRLAGRTQRRLQLLICWFRRLLLQLNLEKESDGIF